jgi:hypothetical protein
MQVLKRAFLQDNSIDISVFGLPSHQRSELVEMSPMKELRRQLVAAAAAAADPVISKPDQSFAHAQTLNDNINPVITVDATATIVAASDETVVVATVVAPTATIPTPTTVVATAVVATPSGSTVAEITSLPKRKRTAVDASLTSADEDSRKKMDVRIENVRETHLT